ncbi:MAG: hypothetical protein HRU70_07085 [Phycisphaeraceae bacterium]|nr:MAG: hypothetical protein HRU70_07085 [Phycisphaeraceae bacterium]
MKGAAAAVAMAALSGMSAAQVEAGGPDVIVGDLHQLTRWGEVGGITAYSVGTVSCNIGNQNLLWIWNTNQHPVIGQNMYRFKDGRFDQIGMSWLKHGFTALTENLCNQCSGMGGSVLGVGCSDPYSASLNGQRVTGGNSGGLGARNQVNAYTGAFTWPPQRPPQTNAIEGRLQVRNTDIDQNARVGARYFVEGQYVTPDDANSGNGENNASYREVQVTGTTTYNISFISGRPTRRMRPAIEAWKESDPLVTIRYVGVPNEGLFIAGFKVDEIAPGRWRYDYAVQNLNSHRAASGLEMPVPACATTDNIRFSAPFYHSGEPYSNDAWLVSEGSGTLAWSSPQTFAQNPNTNALRWGTMYSFGFESDRPPVSGSVTLRLFRPGAPDSVAFVGLIPRALTDLNGDGMSDFFDVDAYVEAFESDSPVADFNRDGFVDFFDFDAFMTAFENGC